MENTIKQILKEAILKLKQEQVEDASLKAKLVLQAILKKPKEYLIIHEQEVLEDNLIKLYKQNIEKIIQGVPVQYITKHQEFMKLDFEVNENVLIPQPDTEILVEEVLELIKNMPNAKVLDIGCGSGAIAISIAKYNSIAEVYSSDISKDALEVAKKNAYKNNVNVKFILSNMFENIEGKFDVIVSNSPYIKRGIIGTLSKEVQNEPKLALDGGEDGLEFYKILSKEAKNFLKPNGILALEIGYDQKNEVYSLLKEYKEIYVKQDLNQNDRVIIAKLGG